MATYDQSGRNYDDGWLYDAEEAAISFSGVGIFSAQVPDSIFNCDITIDGNGTLSINMGVNYAVAIAYTGTTTFDVEAILAMPAEIDWYGTGSFEANPDLFVGFDIDWSQGTEFIAYIQKIKSKYRTTLINYQLIPRS